MPKIIIHGEYAHEAVAEGDTLIDCLKSLAERGDEDLAALFSAASPEATARHVLHGMQVLSKMYANRLEMDEIMDAARHALKRPFPSRYSEQAWHWITDEEIDDVLKGED